MKSISLKAVFNKNNKQINFSLPKKKLPIAINKKLSKLKSMKIKIEDYYFED